MNRLENWFCASSFWRSVTRKQLLPWLLAETELGHRVLEIGAGAGAATEELRKQAVSVTSLEYSRELVKKLVQRGSGIERDSGSGGSLGKAQGKEHVVLQGDATALPFRKQTFSAVIAVLMLHHLPSQEAQDRAFVEVFRVLKPGGVLLAVEIENSWLNRFIHIRSTFVPVAPEEVAKRLGAAGFSGVMIEFRSGAFRIRAEAKK